MTDISKFKDLYVSESEDQLQILNENLLVLEKAINNGESNDSVKDVLDVLMRASHTIKGSSATMSFIDMAYLAHVMEDVYDGARNNIVELTPEMIDYAFQAVDKLEESLDSIKQTDKELVLKGLADELKKATGVNTEGVGKSNRKKAEDAKAEDAKAENQIKAGLEVPRSVEIKIEEPKIEEPKIEEPKIEEPKIEEPKIEEPKIEDKD
ncbi:Hpt domain-containing protein, partial [Patescibacteria group bacterium]|nr:Hpt domain-containing protein [Patescibacteria group bacterium]